MIHADDPLGRRVEKQDLPGVFLLYGGEIQLFTADADFLLVFVMPEVCPQLGNSPD